MIDQTALQQAIIGLTTLHTKLAGVGVISAEMRQEMVKVVRFGLMVCEEAERMIHQQAVEVSTTKAALYNVLEQLGMQTPSEVRRMSGGGEFTGGLSASLSRMRGQA